MKVILLENVKRIGSIGEVIDVKRGFARNFLIANKKALYASKENIKEVEKIKTDLIFSTSLIFSFEAYKAFLFDIKKFLAKPLFTSITSPIDPILFTFSNKITFIL